MYIYCKPFKNFTLQFKDCCEANVNPHRIKAVPPVYWFWQAFFEYACLYVVSLLMHFSL